MDVQRPEEFFYSKSNSKAQDKILLEPYLQFQKQNERDNRYLPKTLNSFNHWMKIPEDKVSIIEAMTTMERHATVFFNTLKDDSIVNNEEPTIHSIHDIPSVINSMNYARLVALEKAYALKNRKIIMMSIEKNTDGYKCLSKLNEWSEDLHCPTEEEYKKICGRLRANAFNGVAKGMQEFSSNKSDFTELCNILGLFFALYDDFADMSSKKGSFDRIYRNRIAARLYSLPIIHAFRTQPGNDALFQIFRKKSTETHLIEFFIASLKKIGSFEYTKNTMIDLKKEADEEMKKLGGNPDLSKILDEMLQDLTID